MRRVHFPIAKTALGLAHLHNSVGEDGYPDECEVAMLDALDAVDNLAELYGDSSAGAIVTSIRSAISAAGPVDRSDTESA